MKLKDRFWGFSLEEEEEEEADALNFIPIIPFLALGGLDLRGRLMVGTLDSGCGVRALWEEDGGLGGRSDDEGADDVGADDEALNMN